ncbi:hypothetical protein LZ30DRAFT_708759 [Colletotrichum cereale]|nr:hypothetical protein LZ30DRAFT_708759 [Colletotrichum cereale]
MRIPGYAWRLALRSHRRYAIFSVHGNEGSHKYRLVDTVHKTFHQFRRGSLELQDALVILASRPYASWLQDDHFMAALVDPFMGNLTARRLPPSKEFNVLAAVVDGLHPLRAMGDIPHGFSFFYGPMAYMMPTLWKDGGQPEPLRESKLQAAITFQTTRKDLADRVECKLPLANTIFQNGLQSTLLASRWHRPELDELPKLLQVTEKQSQDVIYWEPPDGLATRVEPPLVPITAPRKILAGLGNIVRQIDVDGKETPASAELETAVNELYARRTKEGHKFPPGPVGVWAMVVPPGPCQAADLKLLQEWTGDLSEIQTAYDEWGEALAFKGLFQEFLRRGSRVYKILSGGGGWGKKQGLLSLDPETTYSASSEEEDLESFIRSFENRHMEGAEQGVVSPGAYIQFFVSPPMSARPDPPRPRGSTFVYSFGTSVDATSEESPSTGRGSSEWNVVPEHFGAVSNHGLFVKHQTIVTDTTDFVTESKLDVPGTWVGCLKESNT